MSDFSIRTPTEVRDDLLERREIALLDVREEAAHATGHPLFAANLSLSRIELEAYTRLPRRSVDIVLFGEDDEQAQRAAKRLRGLGYTDVKLLAGGLEGWRHAGYEIFIDVNAPSKAFGELVEVKRHTPSLTAESVQAMIEHKEDFVIVDVRRYEEYQTMSIPSGISVPGAELVLRIRELAPDPKTKVIVNCGGRTRGIIGTQSLLNAGIPNDVAALRNGTIGWKLAQQQLTHGASQSFPATSLKVHAQARLAARRVADKAGVRRIDEAGLATLLTSQNRTIYRFDVRTPNEYTKAHIPGFHLAPGGQLVQETEMFAPVRGAHIVLADDDGSRANMTASWLAQMGWVVSVLDDAKTESFSENGTAPRPLPALPEIEAEFVASPQQVKDWLASDSTVLLDFTPSQQYQRAHIPCARFALRSDLHRIVNDFSDVSRFIVSAADLSMASFAYADMLKLTSKPIFLFDGSIEHTDAEPRFASQPIDRYQRPYEGVSASKEAMQAYLDWEAGLVDQLARDGTHHFQII